MRSLPRLFCLLACTLAVTRADVTVDFNTGSSQFADNFAVGSATNVTYSATGGAGIGGGMLNTTGLPSAFLYDPGTGARTLASDTLANGVQSGNFTIGWDFKASVVNDSIGVWFYDGATEGAARPSGNALLMLLNVNATSASERVRWWTGGTTGTAIGTAQRDFTPTGTSVTTGTWYHAEVALVRTSTSLAATFTVWDQARTTQLLTDTYTFTGITATGGQIGFRYNSAGGSNTLGFDYLTLGAAPLSGDPGIATGGGVAEALQYWEYCNHTSGTALSDLRISHGYPEPYNVRLWCLGNEVDGPWQMGHKTADEYGRLAYETARALKQCDPSLELIVAGSCSRDLPTFPEWDRIVLEHTYEFVDHISLHIYVNDNELPDIPAFLAVGLRMDSMIRTISATCDYVKALKRGKKDIHLAFDEWNVWHWKNMHPPGFKPWDHAPAQVEQTYTMAEAVIFGSLIISLLRHADRVPIGNLAQLVNVIAPIMTEPGGPAWKLVIFYPFQHASQWGRGEVIFTRLECPTYETKEFGEVPYIDAVAVRDGDTVTIFAINRHLTEPLPLLLALPIAEHLALSDPDPLATNTVEEPDRIVPREAPQPGTLPPLSWNVLRLQLIG